MQSVLITGGTGFIGKALAEQLHSRGADVWVLTRQKSLYNHLNSDTLHFIGNLRAIPAVVMIDVIINLAGEPLTLQRWNTKYKQRIIDSRVQMTEHIGHWLAAENRAVETFISGSAIGWYGHQGGALLDESSAAVDGFSHKLCHEWEWAATQVQSRCKRVVNLRTGIVLGSDGGALKEMLLPFKLGLGGAMGSGQQYFSWIHRDDYIRLVMALIDDGRYQGPVNATAPMPVTQAEFARTLAEVLNRPAFMRLPAFLLRLLIGEFASEMLVHGQRVMPAKALHNGFEFNYPDLSSALSQVLSAGSD